MRPFVCVLSCHVVCLSVFCPYRYISIVVVRPYRYRYLTRRGVPGWSAIRSEGSLPVSVSVAATVSAGAGRATERHREQEGQGLGRATRAAPGLQFLLAGPRADLAKVAKMPRRVREADAFMPNHSTTMSTAAVLLLSARDYRTRRLVRIPLPSTRRTATAGGNVE